MHYDLIVALVDRVKSLRDKTNAETLLRTWRLSVRPPHETRVSRFNPRCAERRRSKK